MHFPAPPIIHPMNDPNHRRPPAVPQHVAEALAFTLRYDHGTRINPAGGMVAMLTLEPLVRRSKRALKPLITATCLVLGATALSACSSSVNCSGAVYRNGCLAGTDSPVAAAPATAAPVSVPHPAISYGDPKDFADIDDKQCRSYGLTFGSHDYADCRIRLSAQHRGLDPNIGTTMPAPGNR